MDQRRHFYGGNFPPTNPYFSGIPLAYPFMFDFTSAVLAKLGLPINWSLQLPGIIFGSCLVILLFKLTEKLTNSSLAAFFTVLIFMFSGGLGFLFLIPSQSILPVPPSGVKELTHLFEANIQWINFIISEMVPQRGILAGICSVLVIFNLWLDKSRKTYLLAGIVAGLTPFFHAHSFIAVCFIACVFCLYKPSKLWLYFFIPAGVLALPQFIYFMPQVAGYSQGFLRTQIGWTAHVQNDQWLWFWVKNLGVEAFLIPLFWLYSLKRNRLFFWLYLPFLLLFVACNIWIFQPWENDNTKLLRFWFLGSSILIGWGLAIIWKQSAMAKMVTLILLVIITFSGAYDSFSWLDFNKNKLQMWSTEEIQFAEIIKTGTPRKSVFLTTDSHNHWVVDLAGRQIVMGFRGWLWSWGINYTQREGDVRKMFLGDPETPKLLAKYNIDYVVIGYGEKTNFNANENYYLSHYPLFIDMNNQKIFSVHSAIIRNR